MYSKQIDQIRQITDFKPEIAVVLGSGLGEFANNIDVVASVKYSDIDEMPVSTAPEHKGNFIFGYIGEKKIVAMQGRVHLYEGYSPKQVVMPIRLVRLLGCEKIILTNASGGINKNLGVGDFMMIDDHISSFVESPLIGNDYSHFGERFPDMSNAYDKELRSKIRTIAKELGIKLQSGVYAQLTGPQFETPAEIKMLSSIGADAVGMSTVIETIAAVHCGLKVCCVSLITNLACGILDKPLSGEEVTETAKSVEPEFERLIEGIIKGI